MINFKILISAIAFCLMLPADALAIPVEEKNLIKGKSKISPEMGYIYLHGPGRQNGMFLKLPSDEDVEVYALDWDEAFIKAKAKYEKKMKRYPKRLKVAKMAGKKPPEEPIEPTKDNFTIDPIELRNNIKFGPQFVFSKAAKSEVKFFSYLNEVEPGTYIYYGPILFNPNNGYFGTCFCMGSVKFEVKPGIVTNIGNFLGAAPDYASVNTQVADIKAAVAATTLVIPELDYELPETLQVYDNEIPDFRASGKIDNHFGVTIDRIPPIEGVLSYNRDAIVDIKALIEETAVTVETAAEPAEVVTDGAIVNKGSSETDARENSREMSDGEENRVE